MLFITLFFLSVTLSQVQAGGKKYEKIHFKIHVPEIIHHHKHTKVVYLHKPKKMHKDHHHHHFHVKKENPIKFDFKEHKIESPMKFDFKPHKVEGHGVSYSKPKMQEHKNIHRESKSYEKDYKKEYFTHGGGLGSYKTPSHKGKPYMVHEVYDFGDKAHGMYEFGKNKEYGYKKNYNYEEGREYEEGRDFKEDHDYNEDHEHKEGGHYKEGYDFEKGYDDEKGYQSEEKKPVDYITYKIPDYPNHLYQESPNHQPQSLDGYHMDSYSPQHGRSPHHYDFENYEFKNGEPEYEDEGNSYPKIQEEIEKSHGSYESGEKSVYIHNDAGINNKLV